MSSAFTTTIALPSTLPTHLTVRVVVMREDGADMTPADIAAAQACYPVAGDDAGVIGKTAPRAAERAPKAGTKAHKAPSKRAAAKR